MSTKDIEHSYNIHRYLKQSHCCCKILDAQINRFSSYNCVRIVPTHLSITVHVLPNIVCNLFLFVCFYRSFVEIGASFLTFNSDVSLDDLRTNHYDSFHRDI